MIMWSKIMPERMIFAELGIEKENVKKITLAEALDKYCKEAVPTQTEPRLWAKKILNILDGKKLIGTLAVKDVQKVFNTVSKTEAMATASFCRGMIAHSIRFVCTGALLEKKVYKISPLKLAETETPEEDKGKLKFSKAKVSAIAHLVPLYAHTGRFAWFKAEVQRQVFSCESDEAGIIEAKKKDMTIKEAHAMMVAASSVVRKIKPPWVIKYNPNESVFIVMRDSDFNALTTKQKESK